jgi:pimeloyl-ACP methyl ester carboxylesterase
MISHHTDFGRGLSLWRTTGHGAATLHFAAANGFPVGAYSHFLRLLAPHHRIHGLENRGMWPDQPAPDVAFSWDDHADDLIAFLEHQAAAGLARTPVIGVGHSIGGALTLLAASKRPDLFSRLVLIDPASLPSIAQQQTRPGVDVIMKAVVEKTLKRRTRWLSREEFASYLPTREIYSSFRREALDDYAQAGLVEDATGGFQIAYQPAWEAHNFMTTRSIWSYLADIRIPTLLLHGESSSLYPAADLEQLTAGFSPAVETVAVKGCGHMVPQEDPHQVAGLMLR